MESTSFIAAFELMNHINGNVTIMSFNKDGFKTYTTTESGQESTNKKTKKTSITQGREVSQFNCIFSREWLGNYHYGTDLDDTYTGSVITKKFMLSMKSLKKEILEFVIYVSPLGENDGIRVQVPKTTGEKRIQFDTDIEALKYVDLFDKYYCNADPIAKPFNKTFQATCASIKHNACTRVTFRMNLDKSTLAAVLFVDDDSEFSTEYLSYNSDKDEKRDTVVDIEVPADSWITKIPKLSLGACTHIYMSNEKRAPLLFKTHIGSQGYAICSIRMMR